MRNQRLVWVFITIMGTTIACGDDVDSGAQDESSDDGIDIPLDDVDRTTPQQQCAFIEQKGAACSEDYFSCEADLEQKFCPDHPDYEEAFGCVGWESASDSSDCWCDAFSCEEDESCPEEISAYLLAKETCDDLPQVNVDYICEAAGICSSTSCAESFNAVLLCLDEIYESTCSAIDATLNDEDNVCSFEFGAFYGCLETHAAEAGVESCAAIAF